MAPTDSLSAVRLPEPAARLTSLPTYVFAWLDELKAAARARGQSLLDLGIGNPDQATPQPIVQVLSDAARDPRLHGYPPFRGTADFLGAAAEYMQRRFGVALDPEREMLTVSGAKEGMAQLTLAYSEPGAVTLVPDIYYPVHARATGLAGGEVHWMPLREEHGFLPDFDAIPAEAAQRARMMILNYPHNPTGAVATLDFWERAVAFCRQYDIILVSDLAYAELTHDGFVAPSALQVEGSRDVVVEFHSLSKSFNMAGVRLGFAAGNAGVLETLHAFRTNMGYGTPAVAQAGGAHALANAESLVPPTVDRYRERRDAMIEGFRTLGWPAEPPRATMFLWLRVPGRGSATAWTERLIDEAGVVVTPGTAFGPGGEGYFRVSLVAEAPVLLQAIERLRRAGIGY